MNRSPMAAAWAERAGRRGASGVARSGEPSVLNVRGCSVVRWACAGASLALLAGCSRAPPPEDARTLYDLRCAPCHGAEGRGDGPAAAGRTPRPRDLSDPAWQARTDDAYLRKIVINGGLAVGLSTQMPGSPDLANHPESIEGLVRFVRGLRRP